MPLTLIEIDDLARSKGKDTTKLRAELNEMASRGLVYRTHVQGITKYRLNPPRFVFLRSFFWPGCNDDPRCILPYEAVLQLLQGQDRFAVATCACRQRKNSDPDLPDCRHEIENCLHFGKFADYIIENGLGREIDLKECRAILERAAEAGLVHAASNWQENVDTICNCCACCCVYFQAFHVLKHDSGMNTSNFEVVVNSETCVGCGLCVKRCPMDAMKLEKSPLANNKTGKICTTQPELCIGCGVCAYKCSTKSLILKRRERPVEPPASAIELKKRYALEKKEKQIKEGDTAESGAVYMGDISSGEAIG